MIRRTFAVVAIVAAILACSNVATLDALDRHDMFITFRQPVALPGVTLLPGTYIFEIPDIHQRHVVRVLSRNRSRLYLTALTTEVSRPATLRPNQAITFAEGRRDEPVRVSVWWPKDDLTGRQFAY